MVLLSPYFPSVFLHVCFCCFELSNSIVHALPINHLRVAHCLSPVFPSVFCLSNIGFAQGFCPHFFPSEYFFSRLYAQYSALFVVVSSVHLLCMFCLSNVGFVKCFCPRFPHFFTGFPCFELSKFIVAFLPVRYPCTVPYPRFFTQ